MRRIFGQWITNRAREDDKIVLLVGDIGFGIFDHFKLEFPKRYFNIGISEQALVGIAAGMALTGLKPICYTITPFLIERAYEQIKIDVDSMNTKVMLVGYADYPTQGPTHNELNAYVTMSVFRNIKRHFPLSNAEAVDAFNDSIYRDGPSFVSLKEDKDI